MQPQFSTDLDWQAFAYWSNELSAADRARFEARLEDEQEAREALARVVELSYAVAAAESLTVSPARCQPSHQSPRFVAWSVGFAATALGLLLGLAIGQWPASLPSVNESASHPAEDVNPDLASAWSDIRRSWDELSTPQSMRASDQFAETSDSIEHPIASDWESGELETPSWMTAAVLSQAAEIEPEDNELPNDDLLPGETSEES